MAIAAGALCTFVAFSSLVGLATGNGWARGIMGLVLTLALPAVVVDRSLPKHDVKKARPGLVADATAVVLLGVALVFVGFGQLPRLGRSWYTRATGTPRMGTTCSRTWCISWPA